MPRGIAKKEGAEKRVGDRTSSGRGRSKTVERKVSENSGSSHDNSVNKRMGTKMERVKRSQRPVKFDEFVTEPMKKKKKGGDVREIEVEKEVTSATFYEDGDEVLLEVKGQSTEFGEQFNDKGDEIDDQNRNENRNMMGGNPVTEADTFESDVEIMPIDKEKAEKQEQQEMQKFVDFMRKQGLVIVDLKQ